MKMNKLSARWRTLLATAIFACFSMSANANEANPNYVPTTGLGVDPSVDYAALTQFGPWDDRNYQLTKEDIAILPKDDRFVPGVPAFFKVKKRNEMKAQGFPLLDIYPREVNKEFEIRFGGLIQGGVHFLTPRGAFRRAPASEVAKRLYATDPLPKAAPVLGEGPFDGTLSNNETSIEFHPTNPNIVVAGSNSAGDQRMSFSSDGGVTWGNAGGLPGTCCDPAMDFSSTGSIVYAASLPESGTGGCGFGLCAGVFWSFNNGQNWVGPTNASTASSDKEWIHVDKSAGSPFLDRLYMTWHQGNVMSFARSTAAPTGGASPTPLTFAPTITFAADERGIGSDISTDRAGRVYYVYPSITSGSAEMYMLRSDDGGVTFQDLNGATAGLGKMIYDLHGRFDFAIPAMESRRVFIYASVDVDNSGGPRDGRVYVAFTDENAAAGSPGNGGGSAAASHGWIQVVYSDDQGATWTTAATPHSTSDGATVDRFQPWMDVDNLGNVHIGWQDTRNSGAGARNKADWYYAVSADGGATFVEETRVSSVVSENIANGQEWGDYNGLSVSADNNVVGMTWTDNRIVTPPSTVSQRSFAGRVQNQFAGPSYGVNGSNTTQVICAANVPVNTQSIPLAYNVLQGFNSPVSVAFTGPLPAGITGNLSAATITPPGNLTASATLNTGVTPGSKVLEIVSTSGTIIRRVNVNLDVFTAPVGTSTLTAPANNATNQATTQSFTWQAATQVQSYRFELARDAAFTQIVNSQVVTGTTAQVANLSSNTQFFWRVTSTNACPTPTVPGDLLRDGFEDLTGSSSATSAVFSFTTVPGPGDCPVGSNATVVFSDNMEAGAPGWISSAVAGTNSWALSTAFPASPTNAYRGIGPVTVSDQRLVSPAISVPATGASRSLVFSQRIGLEPRSGGGCWDAGILEVSTDGGVIFTQITAGITGVPYTGAIQGTTPTVQGWCGNATAHQTTAVDLAPYAGQTVQFRFKLTSDSSVSVGDGWNIDDVKVQTCSTPGAAGK
jgi:hypothetical protein